MRNEAGESRGFGFVSFQSPDQGAQPFIFKNTILNIFM
jgi:hypothetical protein